jgi:hypothetical protein
MKIKKPSMRVVCDLPLHIYYTYVRKRLIERNSGFIHSLHQGLTEMKQKNLQTRSYVHTIPWLPIQSTTTTNMPLPSLSKFSIFLKGYIASKLLFHRSCCGSTTCSRTSSPRIVVVLYYYNHSSLKDQPTLRFRWIILLHLLDDFFIILQVVVVVVV